MISEKKIEEREREITQRRTREEWREEGQGISPRWCRRWRRNRRSICRQTWSPVLSPRDSPPKTCEQNPQTLVRKNEEEKEEREMEEEVPLRLVDGIDEMELVGDFLLFQSQQHPLAKGAWRKTRDQNSKSRELKHPLAIIRGEGERVQSPRESGAPTAALTQTSTAMGGVRRRLLELVWEWGHTSFWGGHGGDHFNLLCGPHPHQSPPEHTRTIHHTTHFRTIWSIILCPLMTI